jgi:hypothetical protein
MCNEWRIFSSFLIPQQRYHDETRRENDDTLMVRMKEWLMSYNDGNDGGGYRGIKQGDEPGVPFAGLRPAAVAS